MNKEKAPQPPAAPVINVVLPNNLYRQYLPASGPLPLSAPQATGLIPVTHEPGSKLNIETFLYDFQPLRLNTATIERKCLHQNTWICTYGDGRIAGNGFQGRRDC